MNLSDVTPNLSRQVFDVDRIRKEFPILKQKSRGKPLIYLDNAATTQKPKRVIEATRQFYENSNANIHRGVYELSERASLLYEDVRKKVCHLLGTQNEREVVFTRGTTESINLVAQSWGRKFLKPGDRILVSRLEHHSNFVPWQWTAKVTGASFEIIDLDENFEISVSSLESMLSKGGVKIVSLSAMSNALGAIPDLKKICSLVSKAGAKLMIDCAQSIAHTTWNLIDHPEIDFLAFSGHKMFGPTGVGVLWARESLLEAMDPYQLGGDMISRVQDTSASWNELPYKFEAGTPNIAGVIGLGVAIDFLRDVGRADVIKYEDDLVGYTWSKFAERPNLKVIGPGQNRARGPVFSFLFDSVHPHDLATFLDHEGIAIRAGHHCTQPLMSKYSLTATNRISLSMYTLRREVDSAFHALDKALTVFKPRMGRL